jgi:3-oxoadipate enol-lactonase
MAFARIGDAVLHYRLGGTPGGAPLVFVNSLGTDARIWDEVIALLPEYTCLSYDKRGHGLSDAPPGDYRLGAHLDDLEGLLDRTGMGPAVLVGVSVGGLIGQGLALRAPHRLKGLVLCDTAPRMGDPDMWTQRISLVRTQGMAALAHAVMERWFSAGFRREHPEALAGWRNLLLRTPAAGYAGTCATLRDTDLTAEIGNITLPTLVVCGEEDLASPVELVRAAADAIAGARFEVLPGVGHIPSLEQPVVLAGLIRDFLKEVGHG